MSSRPDLIARPTGHVYGGVAKLIPVLRMVQKIDAAHEDFVRAAALFPPQKDIFSVNPVLAQIVA